MVDPFKVDGQIASRPVSRVLYGHQQQAIESVVIIHLGCQLLGTSARPTRTTDLETGWTLLSTLSLFGFAPDGVYHAAAIAGARGGLLPHLFTLPASGGLFSVALSLGLARKRFPSRVLPGIVFPWSPDFPPLRPFEPSSSDHPTGWQMTCKPG